jgi:hypothetical protein
VRLHLPFERWEYLSKKDFVFTANRGIVERKYSEHGFDTHTHTHIYSSDTKHVHSYYYKLYDCSDAPHSIDRLICFTWTVTILCKYMLPVTFRLLVSLLAIV